MNAQTRRRFRRLTGQVFFWKKAQMPWYWRCPHEYVVRQRDLGSPDVGGLWGAPWRCTESEFQFLKRVIAEHGTRMKWRHRNDVVLFDGRYCYWRCEGIINRTYRISYLNGGRPSEETLAKLRKRFWPTRKDRRYYNYIDKF
jgi:hypothetical protein